MSRILHLNPGNLYGGIETYLVTLAKFRQVTPECDLEFGICYPGRFEDELKAANAVVHNLGAARLSRPWTVFAARRRMSAWLLSNRPNVVAAHGLWSLAVFGPTVKQLGIPLVYLAHNTFHGTHWLERWGRRTVPDLIVSNSRYTDSSLETAFPGVPREICYCPVPPNNSAPQSREIIRKEFGVSPETTVFLQVGRLERWKGHPYLLDALAVLPTTDPWECWIVGGPQRDEERIYLDELRTKVEQIGLSRRVRFLGQRGDVPQLMTAADVFCQFNETPEPFGIVFVEALYAGLPIVAANTGGALELVPQNCGFLVPPRDSHQYAIALGKLHQSPELRRRLGGHGPEQATKTCNPETQIARLNLLLLQHSERSSTPGVGGSNAWKSRP